MPELPEVETIARGLHKRVTGDRIESVWIGSKPEPLKSPAAEISRTLEGTRIEQVRRVGKHIVFDLAARSKSSESWPVLRGAPAVSMNLPPSRSMSVSKNVTSCAFVAS